MANAKLKAEPRSDLGKTKNRHLRGGGKIPAVLYGKGEAPTHLLVDEHELNTVVRSKARMIDLTVGSKTHTTFLKEVQRDAIEENILHADFHHVRMDQALKVRIPLHLKGVAAGLAEGGIVTQLSHEITVECLPADLPDHVECSLAALKLDQSVHLKDLSLPARVKAVGDPETVLVICQKPKEEVAAAAPGAEGEGKEPELIKKERAEKEGDEEEKKEGGAKPEGKKAEPAKGEDKDNKEKKK